MTCQLQAPFISSVRLLLLLLPILTAESNGQAVRSSRTYVSAAIGASRSCDGLDFIDVRSLSQWSPMLTLGLGLRINDYFGIEAQSALMLSDLTAQGTLISTRESASVSAGHQSFVISPKLYLPLSAKSEVFLRAGVGFLLSQSSISSPSNPSVAKSSSNMGYMTSLGYARQIGSSTVATLQVELSDTYGSAGAWSGGLCLMSIGVLYAFDERR